MDFKNYGTFPSVLPVIVERELFLYPFMISPLFLSNEDDIKAATDAIENNLLVMICPSKDVSVDGDSDFYKAGVIGTIMRKVVLPDKRIKLLFQGLSRGKILNLEEKTKGYFEAMVDLIPSNQYDKTKVDALLDTLREQVKKFANSSNMFPVDLLNTLNDSGDPNRIIDLVASTLRIKKEQSYKLFIDEDVENRLMILIQYVIEQIESLKLQKEIKTKVHSKIDKVNREYFLKEQLKQIRKELGEDTQREEELDEYYKKLEAKKANMPEDGYKEIKKQLDKLSHMHPDSADANILQTYVEWSLDMPFGSFSKGTLSVKAVDKRLDSDHYSLKKPKDRIVEFFAVKELLELRGISNKEARGTILCFIGPPGVGKTSLANSIAKALKRELVRIALGGMEDVNELRGHRRTYIGAMPGRLVQGLIEAKSMDPVVVLDEIDKIGRSMRGDPTSALLEILDPEQNIHFRDYYLNFHIDLSKVVFIATANDYGTIPPPLRDRLEFIHLSSYTPQEKFEIAKRYLIPQELKKHGLKKIELNVTPPALKEIIDRYTREAGVRTLRRKLAMIMRKAARDILENPEKSRVSVTVSNIKKFLDKEVFDIEESDEVNYVGVVNGLAWTSVGGDVLKIEAIKIRGKGMMQLTGSLGEVMKESAKIAFSVVKTLIDENKLDFDKSQLPTDEKTKQQIAIYNAYDLHIHVPEGATPKDGPSAGITMATAIASILTDKKVRGDVAMTGELTLTGKVLPIGGLKEKLIAAYKAKIKTILISQKNYDRDLNDIPDEVLKNLEIFPVKTVEDVLKIALIY